MENFIVSARKYRPARFNTVVGQQHITNTLKNAIKNNHLAQSFLFCGPRGVGKTTCARILAKVLNCEAPAQDIEPCNECNSCRSFNQSSSFNVHELDAASNNTVEDIRSLIEQVRIPPQSGRYKIYIIDEVHMLSTAAFNAFLKTLEEPPVYAIFILATTEKHKIIPTILSRCQIFDFKRIQAHDITSHLQEIAEKENIDAEKEALQIIAQKSDGALRDALSIFDRIISFSDNRLTYTDVVENLNILDYEYFFSITDALIAEDVASVLHIFDEILNNGFDGDDLVLGLSEHFRNLLVCKDPQTLSLLECSDNLKDRYLNQSKITPASFLLSALNLANQCDIHYKASKNKRLHVEMALIKMTYLPAALDISSEHDYRPRERVKPAPEKTQIPAPQLNKKVEKPESTGQETPTEVKPPDSKEKQKVEEKKESYQPTVKIPTLEDIKADLGKAENTPEEASEDIEKANEEAAEPLRAEDIESAWQKYVEETAKNKHRIHAVVKDIKPEMKGKTMEIAVANQLQYELLDTDRSDLANFLKKELKQNIILVLKIDKSKEEKNTKPFTTKEKFQKMTEKNPKLIELKNKLGLEFDF